MKNMLPQNQFPSQFSDPQKFSWLQRRLDPLTVPEYRWQEVSGQWRWREEGRDLVVLIVVYALFFVGWWWVMG